ncbi:MAG: hypothetical protein HYR55_15435 [Acidobacteria bacterium]|nr:hypothetical protein [Acidobacteriota bacterium]
MVRAKIYGLIGIMMGLLGGIQARAEATLAYYHTDHLGSVRMITDSQGTVISVHDYFPYGKDTTPTPSNRPKFTGQLRDHESGLDYFGARYYVNTYGRFTSPDDVRNDSYPSNPQSWNLYAYARNNPLRFIDPTGEAVEASNTAGKLLCKDTDCTFDKNRYLIVGDNTFAPNQYTVGDPNPYVTVTSKTEPVALLNSFGLPLSQFGEYHGRPEPGLMDLTPHLVTAMISLAGVPNVGLTIKLIGNLDPANLTDKVGRMAAAFRRSPTEVKDAIHEAKKFLPRGGRQRNPDVLVDITTGEIYPRLPMGT